MGQHVPIQDKPAARENNPPLRPDPAWMRFLLLNFQKRLSNANGKLVVFGMSEDIQGIFSIVNMDNYISIYKTRSEFESSCQEG